MACCGKKPVKKKYTGAFRVRKIGGKQATLSAQSAGPPKKTFLLCRPSFYGINYEINPWMTVSNPASRPLAQVQWSSLGDRLKEHGAEVLSVKPREGLPDMVFTANAGLILKDSRTFILSNFKYDQRKGEEQWFLEWFLGRGFMVKTPKHHFEGAGDALMFNGKIVCGYGFRSDEAVYDEIRDFVGGRPLVKAELIDSRFYHLDTCFCPLAGTDYLIYPKAFSETALGNIRGIGGNEIAVPDEEAVKFACNAVVIDRTVIMPKGCPVTMQKLEQASYNPVPVDMSEFIKAGGACKCLTIEV